MFKITITQRGGNNEVLATFAGKSRKECFAWAGSQWANSEKYNWSVNWVGDEGGTPGGVGNKW